MHIEPGYIAQAKVIAANVSAIGVLALYAKSMIQNPITIFPTTVKTLLAAVFFSIFMQSFHMSIGPSELHFVGASAMYMTLGFLPTLFGFALGLLLQGLLFEPADLPHLAVNALSLITPLIAVHYAFGRKFFEGSLKMRVSWASILKFDAAYYGGVTGMVGFWLFIGQVETPFVAWATFASSYLAIVALEPIVTYGLVKLLKANEGSFVISRFFSVGSLSLSK